jgi:hypothetical protein
MDDAAAWIQVAIIVGVSGWWGVWTSMPLAVKIAAGWTSASLFFGILWAILL